MRPLDQILSDYAAYHRDRRNVATHALGIPLIILSLTILLARPALDLAGAPITFALAIAAAFAAYCFRLDAALGAIMSFVLLIALALGQLAATLPTRDWLTLGVGAFVIGWIFQLIGHFFEGRKPAFLDDIRSLAVGPLFVLCEGLFLLGWRPELKAQIQARGEAA